MSETTIHVRASREDVHRAIAMIPSVAISNSPEARTLMSRCGTVVLTRIRDAFLAKTQGGTDDAGQKWVPLSPTTIAYRRRHAGIPRNRTSFRPSFALSDSERDKWWTIYRQQLSRFKGDKGSAARVAWAILKRSGAKTLIGMYGTAKVEILRDTGRLLSTLSPGEEGGGDRIFRILPGEVVVGTRRKGALAHHNGVRGRLPQRRLWPEPKIWPATWWHSIGEQAQLGLLEIALHLLGAL
jgi:hypothetical protein